MTIVQSETDRFLPGKLVTLSGSETCDSERDDMAKKKAPKVAAKGVKSTQKILISYKADVTQYEAFKDWLDRFAAHVGAPVTITMDMALKRFAAEHKFEPPPKRLGR